MPKGFGANFAKSFAGALKDYMMDNALPNLKEATSSSTDFLKEKFSNKDKGSKTDINKKVSEIKNYANDNVKQLTRNVLSDLKSGKWFGDNEREEKETAKAFGFDFDDFEDSFDMMDSEDFGDGDNNMSDVSSEEYGDLVQNDNRHLAIDNKSFSSKVIRVNNTKIGADYKELSRLQVGLNQKIISSMGVVSEQVQQLAQFNIDVTQNFYDKTFEFYDQSLEMLSSINDSVSYLKQENTYDEFKDKFSKIFGSGGVIDIKGYITTLFNQNGGGMGGLLSPDMIKMMVSSFVANPLKQVFTTMMDTMLPKNIKDTFKNMNDFIADYPKAMMLALNKQLNDKTGSKLAKMLGIKYDPKEEKAKALNNYNKKATPFDGVTKKAIVQIIPSLLSKIYAALSGNNLVPDYKTGRLVDGQKVNEEINKNRRERTNSSASTFTSIMNDSLKKSQGLELEKEDESLSPEELKKVKERNKLKKLQLKDNENLIADIAHVVSMNGEGLSADGVLGDHLLAELERFGHERQSVTEVMKYWNVVNKADKSGKINRKVNAELFDTARNEAKYMHDLANSGEYSAEYIQMQDPNYTPTPFTVGPNGEKIFATQRHIATKDNANYNNALMKAKDTLTREDVVLPGDKSTKKETEEAARVGSLTEYIGDAKRLNKLKKLISYPFALLTQKLQDFGKGIADKINNALFGKDNGKTLSENIKTTFSNIFNNFLGQDPDDKKAENTLGYKIRAMFFGKDSDEVKDFEDKFKKDQEKLKQKQTERQITLAEESLNQQTQVTSDVRLLMHEAIENPNCIFTHDVHAEKRQIEFESKLFGVLDILVNKENKIDIPKSDTSIPLDNPIDDIVDIEEDIPTDKNNKKGKRKSKKQRKAEKAARIKAKKEAKLNNNLPVKKKTFMGSLKEKILGDGLTDSKGNALDSDSSLMKILMARMDKSVMEPLKKFIIGKDDIENGSLFSVITKKLDLHVLSPFKDMLIGDDKDKFDKNEGLLSIAKKRIDMSVIAPLKEKIVGKDGDKIDKNKGLFSVIKDRVNLSVLNPLKEKIVGKDKDDKRFKDKGIIGSLGIKATDWMKGKLGGTKNDKLLDLAKNKVKEKTSGLYHETRGLLMKTDKDHYEGKYERYKGKGLMQILSMRVSDTVKGIMIGDNKKLDKRNSSFMDILKTQANDKIFAPLKKYVIGDNKDMDPNSSLFKLMYQRFDKALLSPLKDQFIGDNENDEFAGKKSLLSIIAKRAEISLFRPIMKSITGKDPDPNDKRGILTKILDFFKPLADYAKELFAPVLDMFNQVKDSLKNTFKSFLQPAFEEVKFQVFRVGKFLLKSSAKIVTGIFDKLFSKEKGLFSRLMGGLSKLFLNTEKGLGGILTKVVKAPLNIMSSIGDKLKEKQTKRIKSGKVSPFMHEYLLGGMSDDERVDTFKNYITTQGKDGKGLNNKVFKDLDKMKDTDRDRVFKELKDAGKINDDDLKRYGEHKKKMEMKTRAKAEKGDPASIAKLQEEQANEQHKEKMTVFNKISDAVVGLYEKFVGKLEKGGVKEGEETNGETTSETSPTTTVPLGNTAGASTEEAAGNTDVNKELNKSEAVKENTAKAKLQNTAADVKGESGEKTAEQQQQESEAQEAAEEEQETNKGILSGIKDMVTNTKVFKSFSKIWGSIKGFGMLLFSAIKSGFKVVKTIGTAIGKVIPKVLNWLKSKGITDKVKGGINKLKETKLGKFVTEKASVLKDKFKNSKLGGKISKAFGKIKGKASDTINRIKESSMSPAEKTVMILSTISEQIEGIAEKLGVVSKSKTDEVADNAKDKIEDVLNPDNSNKPKLINKFKSKAGSGLSNLGSKLQGVGSKLSGKGGVKGKLGGMLNKIGGGLGTAGSKLNPTGDPVQDQINQMKIDHEKQMEDMETQALDARLKKTDVTESNINNEKTLSSKLREKFKDAKVKAREIFDDVQTKARSAYEWVETKIRAAIKKAGTIKENAVKMAGSLKESAIGIAGKVKNVLVDSVWTKIKGGVTTGIETAGSGVKAVASAVQGIPFAGPIIAAVLAAAGLVGVTALIANAKKKTTKTDKDGKPTADLASITKDSDKVTKDTKAKGEKEKKKSGTEDKNKSLDAKVDENEGLKTGNPVIDKLIDKVLGKPFIEKAAKNELLQKSVLFNPVLPGAVKDKFKEEILKVNKSGEKTSGDAGASGLERDGARTSLLDATPITKDDKTALSTGDGKPASPLMTIVKSLLGKVFGGKKDEDKASTSKGPGSKSTIDKDYNKTTSKTDRIINTFIQRFFAYKIHLMKEDNEYIEGSKSFLLTLLGMKGTTSQIENGIMSRFANAFGGIADFFNSKKKTKDIKEDLAASGVSVPGVNSNATAVSADSESGQTNMNSTSAVQPTSSGTTSTNTANIKSESGIVSSNKAGLPIDPAKFWISSTFGYRDDPFGSGKIVDHSGIDLAAAEGTEIRAVADGEVVWAQANSESAGNFVNVRHPGLGNMISRYLHMVAPSNLKPGDKVKKGDLIGYVGSTGWSTGNHLHFDIGKAGPSGSVINGFDYVDPLSILSDKYALDEANSISGDNLTPDAMALNEKNESTATMTSTPTASMTTMTDMTTQADAVNNTIQDIESGNNISTTNISSNASLIDYTKKLDKIISLLTGIQGFDEEIAENTKDLSDNIENNTQVITNNNNDNLFNNNNNAVNNLNNQIKGKNTVTQYTDGLTLAAARMAAGEI